MCGAGGSGSTLKGVDTPPKTTSDGQGVERLGFWVVWGVDNWYYFGLPVVVSVHLIWGREACTKEIWSVGDGTPFGCRLVGTWNYFRIQRSKSEWASDRRVNDQLVYPRSTEGEGQPDVPPDGRRETVDIHYLTTIKNTKQLNGGHRVDWLCELGLNKQS